MSAFALGLFGRAPHRDVRRPRAGVVTWRVMRGTSGLISHGALSSGSGMGPGLATSHTHTRAGRARLGRHQMFRQVIWVGVGILLLLQNKAFVLWCRRVQSNFHVP